MKNFTIPPQEEDVRLDRYLRRKFTALTQGAIEKALRKGGIKVNNQKISASYRLKAGDQILLSEQLLLSFTSTPSPNPKSTPSINASLNHKKVQLIETLEKNILLKNEDVIVFNKPPGVAVQGGSKIQLSLDDVLDAFTYGQTERPKLVHRLDRDTSGILVVARHTQAARLLTQAFREHQIEKYYLAVLAGTPHPHSGTINFPIEKLSSSEKNTQERVQKSPSFSERAVTHYRVVDYLSDIISLVELNPITGKTHQLRVHTKGLGTPIVGDGKYGGRAAFLEHAESRLHLHAFSLKFPGIKQIPPFFVKAPLPPHIKKTLKAYNLYKS